MTTKLEKNSEKLAVVSTEKKGKKELFSRF